MKAIERLRLRLRGVDPDELEGELMEMDAAKEARERRKREAEEQARKAADNVAIDVLEQG